MKVYGGLITLTNVDGTRHLAPLTELGYEWPSELDSSLALLPGYYRLAQADIDAISAAISEEDLFLIFADRFTRVKQKGDYRAVPSSPGVTTCLIKNIWRYTTQKTHFIRAVKEGLYDNPAVVIEVPKRGRLKVHTAWGEFFKITESILSVEYLKCDSALLEIEKDKAKWPWSFSKLAAGKADDLAPKVTKQFYSNINPLLRFPLLPNGVDVMPDANLTVTTGTVEELQSLAQKIYNCWQTNKKRFTIHSGHNQYSPYVSGDVGITGFIEEYIIPVYQPRGAKYTSNGDSFGTLKGYDKNDYLIVPEENMSSHDAIADRIDVVNWLSDRGYIDGEAILSWFESLST